MSYSRTALLTLCALENVEEVFPLLRRNQKMTDRAKLPDGAVEKTGEAKRITFIPGKIYKVEDGVFKAKEVSRQKLVLVPCDGTLIRVGR